MRQAVPYDEWADLYDVWVARAPVCEANQGFYVDWLSEGAGPAVELGVGNGRITLEVAARGVSVFGVDSSRAMLDLCRARAEEAGLLDRITLLEADFRDFELPEPAARIAIPFHSIGHLIRHEDKQRAFEQVFQQLRPGGLLLFDHFVFDEAMAAERHGTPALETEFVHPESGRDTLLWVTVLHDIPSQMIRVHARTEELDAHGETVRSKTRRMDFSWVHPEQTRELLESAGFAIEALWGDFDRTAFDEHARQQIWLARRPA